MTYVKKWINFLLFSNLFMSWIAAGSCWFTMQVFQLHLPPLFLCLIFFSTLSSYSLHWYLTPVVITHSDRIIWTLSKKYILWNHFIIGSIITLILLILHSDLWIYFLPAALLTFIYTAPKLPFRPFTYLQHWAIAKTLYLSVLWTFVTAILPILANVNVLLFKPIHWIFILNRFLLIHAICILFDFRDRQEDQQNGIKSMITYASTKDLYFLFSCINIGFIITFWFLFQQNLSLSIVLSMIAPCLILLLTFQYSMRAQSDYWFYGMLDGLVLLSSIVLWAIAIIFQ
jgi:hypothetical protein